MTERNIMGSSNVKILTLDQVVLSEAQIEEEIRKFEAEEARKKAEEEKAPTIIINSKFQIFGPGNYKGVMNQISENGLLRPTTAQTLALVYKALQNPDNKNFKILLEKFKTNYLYTCTENLYGKEDVIVYDNIDGNMPSDRTSLIKIMQDGDKSVRVVPYGFNIGRQSVSDFIKNPYVIAQVGDLPLDILADIAEKISKNLPYVYALNSQTKDLVRYSAVDSGWDVDRLVLLGGYDGSNEFSYALGIKQGETK